MAVTGRNQTLFRISIALLRLKRSSTLLLRAGLINVASIHEFTQRINYEPHT